MEFLNSNELASEISQNNVSVDGPPSPVLSTNRRMIINKKLKKQKSKVKFDSQFIQNELNSNDNASSSLENRLKSIEKLKSERKKYYDQMCSFGPKHELNYVAENKQTFKKPCSPIQEYQKPVNISQKVYNSSSAEKQETLNIQTASGKNIIIPDHIINEYKHIFKDILTEGQMSNTTILKLPIKSKLRKGSRIPVLNPNIKSKTNTNASTVANFIKLSQYDETSSQLEPIREADSNRGFDNSLSVAPSRRELTYKTASGENFSITESFLEAAQNMVKEEEKYHEPLDFGYTESKPSTDTMNKLYSNQKFEECSSSTNSLGSFTIKDSLTILDASESTIDSSEVYTNTIRSHPSDDFRNKNKALIMASNYCGELSVTDIVNDDWSDMVYVDKKNVGIKNLIPEVEYENDEVKRKNIQENIPGETYNGLEQKDEILNKNEKSNKYNDINQNIEHKKIENYENLGDKVIEDVQIIKSCDGDATKGVISDAKDKLNDPLNITSTSKSVIHVDIPPRNFDCETKYTKNLIELHRNRNFLGNSEDSASNVDYQVSQHSIQVKKRILKAQKKLMEGDFMGFDKITQESANQKAVIFINNIKEIEKEINKKQSTQAKNKEDRKLKERKSKRHKYDNYEGTKEDQGCSKEYKLRHDKRKKEKSKHNKFKGAVTELPDNTLEQPMTNEEINRTVTYDHISIISEQSCKKYKAHKRRKSIVTDKDVVFHNKDNQTIELSPNQKKFKIEIDCSNKFRINICCNGMQNVCDKEITRDERGINRCENETTKYDMEEIKSDCKAIENTTRALFKSASGKDIMLNKMILIAAEKKFEEIDCDNKRNLTTKHSESQTNQECNDSKITNQKHDRDYAELNEPGQGKFIKKFINKAHKSYRDRRKFDSYSNPDKSLEKPSETDANIKSVQRNNYKEVQNFAGDNFHGFKFASGKNIKISEKSLQRAQKLYQDTEEKSDRYLGKNECSANCLNSNINNNPEVTDTTPLKQRSQMVHSNIGNDDANSKTIVPIECKIVSDPLTKDANHCENESMTESSNEIQNLISMQDQSISAINKLQCGFQSASGKDIKISCNALEKAQNLFNDNNFSAGDCTNYTALFSGFENVLETKVDTCEKQSLKAENMYKESDNIKLCMGDFKKTLSSEKTKGFDRGVSESLNASSSKKAFELLEDVVDTVDCALEKIQKNRLNRSNNVRRRLGISRCKQMNISKEKIEKAKKLFSNENFTESIRDLTVTATPPRNEQIGSHSTPLRSNLLLMKDVQFSKDNIESELTPIRNTDSRKVNYEIASAKDSPIVMQNRTPGTLDNWHATVLKQIDSLKATLRNLEEKKCNLEKQMSFVHYGDKEHRRQRTGVLYDKKTTIHERVPLKALDIENDRNDVENVVLNVTLQNADMIHFNSTSLENKGPTQDGAVIIPNSQNLIGLSEIEMAFRTMIGVEPDLIPKGWIANHYRLIVWKLASYERFFPRQLKGSLSIENIIQQLKYRYDREIDKAQRSAIRKILEKDDVPQKRMILCVTDIIKVENNRIELELSDGWYCVRTIIDEPLMCQVRKKKIRIGTKLVISGSQILNCDGCHPLEVTDFVKLKITYNSTRRAFWYAKLGYQKCPEPFVVSLSSVHSDGGVIGCIKIHILRVYPIRYMEQINDKKVWRNSRAEEKYANVFENERLEKVEKIHYTMQQKYEQELALEMKKRYFEKSKLNTTDILNITCPKTLYSLLENSNDPDSLMETLLPSQRVDVLEYRQKICLQRQQELSRRISDEMEKLKITKRKVVPILKLLVIDDYSVSEKSQQFCIWNPKEEDISLFKEGVSLTVYNVVPRPNGDLFSNSKTYFRVGKNQSSHSKFQRQLFPISMTLDSYYQPLFNEFDTVGLVIQTNVNGSEQNLWVADTTGRMLFIKIKDGPEVCSLLEGIVKGQVVSLLNLIYCKPQKDFGQALANQFTIISNHSQQNHLQEHIELFKMKLPEDLSQFLNECEQNIEKYMQKIDLKQSFITSFMQENAMKSENSIMETSEDSTIIPSRLTATDVAMSLIDTDKFT